MVGLGLKKLAKELGFKVDKGIAYGDYKGYTLSLSEGAGYKLLNIAAKSPSEEKILQFYDDMNREKLDEEYRAMDIAVGEQEIVVAFWDDPGTMKMYRAFIEWFLPRLSLYGFKGNDYCPRCGFELDSNSMWELDTVALQMSFSTASMWVRVKKAVIAKWVHRECIQFDKYGMQNERMIENSLRGYVGEKEQIKQETEKRYQDDEEKNYGKGILGAILGAIAGALFWGYVLPYEMPVAAMALPLGARSGYNFLHGERGMVRFISISVVSIAGLIAGTFLANMYYGVGGSDYFMICLREIGCGMLFVLISLLAVFVESRVK